MKINSPTLFSMMPVLFLAPVLAGCVAAKSKPPAASTQQADSMTESQLADLILHSYEPIEAKPGQSIQLKIRQRSFEITPPMLEAISIPVKWTISPNDGVQLDQHSGELRIDETVKHGAEYTISAVLSKNKPVQTLKNRLIIFRQADNPFVGLWQDTANEINELVFKADGTFYVTAIPFEVYKDYWGTYNYDLHNKRIEFVPKGGNKIPDDADLQGRFRFSDAKTLKFEDIFFGTLTREQKKRNSYSFRSP